MSGGKVLIVDDEPDLIEGIVWLLRDEGILPAVVPEVGVTEQVTSPIG